MFLLVFVSDTGQEINALVRARRDDAIKKSRSGMAGERGVQVIDDV